MPNRTGTTSGYRGPQVCRMTGLTYRQIDWWDRTNLLVPSVDPGTGSGSQRLYSDADVKMALAIRRLLMLGFSLQRIRRMAGGLREAIGRGEVLWTAGLGRKAGVWLDLASLEPEPDGPSEEAELNQDSNRKRSEQAFIVG